MGKVIEPRDIEEAEHHVEVFDIGERAGKWWAKHHFRVVMRKPMTLALIVFTLVNMTGVVTTNNRVTREATTRSEEAKRVATERAGDAKRVAESTAAETRIVEKRLIKFDQDHCRASKLTNAHQAARWAAIADAVDDIAKLSNNPRVRRHIHDIATIADQSAHELKHSSEPPYCKIPVRLPTGKPTGRVRTR